MLYYPNRAKIVLGMCKELMCLLEKGDVLMIKDVTYFEPHANPEKVRAESLYALFEQWAAEQDPPVETTDRTFHRLMFNALSRLNAKKKVQVRVNAKDSSLCILLNSPHFDA